MVRVQAAFTGLLALILTPGFLFYFDVTPKLVVLLAGLGVALLLVPRRRHSPVFSWLVGLSLLSLAVSTAVSTNPALSLYGTSWRRYGAIAQAATLLFAWTVASAGEAAVRPILRATAIAGAISGAYGIAQYFGWDPLLRPEAYHIGEGIWTIVRPPGTLGYASYFATWLLFAVFLGAALRGWLGWTATAVAALAIFATGTRAAMLGLACGVVVWLCYAPPRRWRRLALAAGVLAVAGTAFYFSPAGWPLRSRARWFTEDPWGGARPRLWADSARMAAHRLPAGFGPEVFTANFPHFESKELARAYPDFAHESPHNIFLDALVAQGVPGLLLLTGFCIAGFAGAWRLRMPGLAAALAAGLVSQQFTVFTIPTAVMFYTTIALLAARRTDSPPQANSLPHKVLAVCSALAFVYLAFRFAAADHALELTRQAIQSADVTKAATQYSAYENRRLPGVAADLWYARALMDLAGKLPNPILRFQAMTQAGAAANRALQTAEEPFNAWYNAAQLAATQNDAAGAERCLRAAIAAHPNWFKPHWTLAQLLRLQHRFAEADAEAARALDLDGGKHPEVARSLLFHE